MKYRVEEEGSADVGRVRWGLDQSTKNKYGKLEKIKELENSVWLVVV